MTTMLLATVLGALIGLALGALGGGSILTVPALVYLLGQNPHGAVGNSLVVVGANALMGAWLHQRAGHVRLRAALLFGTAGSRRPTAARLARRLPVARLRQGFAIVVVLLGMALLAINLLLMLA